MIVTLSYPEWNLKGLGHGTINKPVISTFYIVSFECPVCSAQILVDGLNPQLIFKANLHGAVFSA